MYISSYLALAWLGVVQAASSKCSFSTTITAASAVEQLNACQTLEGTIKVTGNEIGALDLSGVKEIKADLTLFNSSSVTNVNLNLLKEISGSLSIDALTQLHAIDFTSLSDIEKLSLVSLPSLAIVNVNTGISHAQYLQISDTALSTLQGLANFYSVGYLDINNNKNITSIELSSLKSVSDNLIFSFNSDECEVKLDNLQWASNITIQDVSSCSLKNLSAVNGSAVFGYNLFKNFSMDSLKYVGGSVAVFANEELTDVDISNLKKIGGELRVFNNTLLTEMTLKNLETVKGAVNVAGNFDNFSLPSLDTINGDFSFKSSSDEFSCKDFDSAHKDKKIEGHNYNCSAPKPSSSSSKKSGSKTSDSQSTGGSSASADSSSKTSSKSSEAISLVSPAMVLASLVGASLALII